MSSLPDLRSMRHALRRLIAFAQAEGWELVIRSDASRCLCKRSMPCIHLGAPSSFGTLARVRQGTASCRCRAAHARKTGP